MHPLRKTAEVIPSLAVAIVAHPKRLAMAHELAADVKAEAVCVDDLQLGCHRNHLRAWRWLAEGNAKYSVVLEDDAIPVEHFRDQVAAALPHAPSPVVSLYLGRGRPPGIQEAISRVIAHDACWITSVWLLHCVGVALPTALIPEMLGWIEELDPIDEAISTFCQQEGLEISYTRPSLVQHRDGPTVMDIHRTTYPEGDTVARNEIRKAWLYGGRPRWDSSVIAM